MPALTKHQLDSAQEFATASIAALKSTEGIHPGTVVAATARMAGTYLFWSFRLSLPGVRPGQAVLSDKANSNGPTLIETTVRLLRRMGITLAPSQAGTPVDPKDQPTLSFLDTQRLLEPAFSIIRTRYGFDDEQAAHAVAAATSLLIRHCAKALAPNLGLSIAAFGFVEGTKTAPDPVVKSNEGA
jgi:hypothetical protein